MSDSHSMAYLVVSRSSLLFGLALTLLGIFSGVLTSSFFAGHI